ncbi:MAG TPA: thiamine pyrophosphate-binding protein, partial [Phenylobacterium sp.]|nr:thiamine pyrophosphate-binding protein [Phenylobacterium sp.]
MKPRPGKGEAPEETMGQPDIRVTGGDLLARTLKAAGVETIFALHGGHHEALFKGCVDHDIALVDVRHE